MLHRKCKASFYHLSLYPFLLYLGITVPKLIETNETEPTFCLAAEINMWKSQKYIAHVYNILLTGTFGALLLLLL